MKNESGYNMKLDIILSYNLDEIKKKSKKKRKIITLGSTYFEVYSTSMAFV